MQSILSTRTDFERRMDALLNSLRQTRAAWAAADRPTSYPDAIAHKTDFAEWKKTSKRSWVRERQELTQLYSNIQTKLRTYSLRSWEPREGLRLEDLESSWAELSTAEVSRSRAINARIREIKEDLRKEFARLAESFIDRVKRIEQAIGSLSGPLQDQKQALLSLSAELPALRTALTNDIAAANHNCVEAKVDENDYTVFTYDDLEFELEIAEGGMRKKIGFVDNQMVSATHTNITPAKLEEFESTFKHFDKDGTNVLTVYEMHSALASLGIVYPDEEVEAIYYQLESQFGALTYEAWLTLLVEITKDDASSADQLREAFRDLAGDKGHVTQQDLKFANLSPEAVRFLSEVMPAVEVEDQAEGLAGSGTSTGFDCELTAVCLTPRADIQTMCSWSSRLGGWSEVVGQRELYVDHYDIDVHTREVATVDGWMPVADMTAVIGLKRGPERCCGLGLRQVPVARCWLGVTGISTVSVLLHANACMHVGHLTLTRSRLFDSSAKTVAIATCCARRLAPPAQKRREKCHTGADRSAGKGMTPRHASSPGVRVCLQRSLVSSISSLNLHPPPPSTSHPPPPLLLDSPPSLPTRNP